jgi:hypothetical protein
MHLKERHTLCYPAHHFEPTDWLRFIQLDLFDRKWRELGLDDDDLRLLQIAIMTGPTKHPLIQHTGGLRKIRFAQRDSHRGKSGSFRVGYVLFESYSIVLLVVAYAKNEEPELTMADRKAIRRIVELIENQLKRGEIR